MLKQEQIQLVEPKILVTKRICYALIVGLLAVSVCLCSIANWNKINTAIDILPIVGMVLGTTHLMMAMFIPNLIAQNQLQAISKEPDSESKLLKFAEIFQTKTIIKFALMEGGSLLNVMLFFLTSNLILLGIAACGLSAMAFAIPKTDSVLEWLSDQLNV